MPRAFLITHKRYSPQHPVPEREGSPELRVNTAESGGAIENRLPADDARKITKTDEVNEILIPGEERHWKISNDGRAVDDDGFFHQGRKIVENNFDKFYNLTKLAEVSLAAAAGQLFWKNYESELNFEKWPVQEYPEDLSQDLTGPKFPDQKSMEVHTCSECGKQYSTSSNLARHRQTHRSLADKKARACPHCDKIYVSMPAYSMHVRTHNQGCKCNYCGKCFSRPWLLQGHIRTHTGEKPFKCTVCEKAFADKSNLRAHVQTHSNMKPHVCGRCGKAFALKSYLYKHEEFSCMKAQPKQPREKEGGTTKGKVEVYRKPVLSVPTPVISLAIRV